MEDRTPFTSASRHITNPFLPFPQGGDPQANPNYASHHIDPNLQVLEAQFAGQLGNGNAQQVQAGNAFEQRNAPPPRFQEIRSQVAAPLGGQFGMLTPHNHVPNHTYVQQPALDRIQHESEMVQERSASGPGKKDGGHFVGMKMVPDPPDLERWRERLFNVNETITMTEDEFQTYFPHVDNVYSHRSTQRYKKKPFVSHYWDCRLKGRPSGTPKSTDPNKKKRKRTARERDLCDVKIKIVEYFPGARTMMGQLAQEVEADGENLFATGENFSAAIAQPQAFGILAPPEAHDPNLPGTNGERYYTITRVNGSGGNGKADGVPGPHKHTLEESDRVKKSSIQRHFLKEEKEKKKVQKTYHKKATGTALGTVKRHSKEHELKLYGSCFCPFVQRVWLALELKDINYQYIEVDPYKKQQSLLEVNPLGLVPALRHKDWSCHESTVLLEYLEDLHPTPPLLPSTTRARAYSRLWSDHINRNLIPSFYRTLQAQDAPTQTAEALKLKAAIDKLVAAADPEGPFFLSGARMSYVDVQVAPWFLRLRRVLKPYRGWPDPEPESRLEKWLEAMEADVDVRATTSGDELYLDSYERYAENRPNTSQLANAVNSGRNLP